MALPGGLESAWHRGPAPRVTVPQQLLPLGTNSNRPGRPGPAHLREQRGRPSLWKPGGGERCGGTAAGQRSPKGRPAVGTQTGSSPRTDAAEAGCRVPSPRPTPALPPPPSLPGPAARSSPSERQAESKAASSLPGVRSGSGIAAGEQVESGRFALGGLGGGRLGLKRGAPPPRHSRPHLGETRGGAAGSCSCSTEPWNRRLCPHMGSGVHRRGRDPAWTACAQHHLGRAVVAMESESPQLAPGPSARHPPPASPPSLPHANCFRGNGG